MDYNRMSHSELVEVCQEFERRQRQNVNFGDATSAKKETSESAKQSEVPRGDMNTEIEKKAAEISPGNKQTLATSTTAPNPNAAPELDKNNPVNKPAPGSGAVRP